MKILWFTSIPSLYDQGTHQYHGCGWIESLERLVNKKDEIELGICFFHDTDDEKLVKDGTSYYPIRKKSIKRNPLKAIINNWRGKLLDRPFLDRYQIILEDFNPDLIQIFGTENEFIKLQQNTDIPIVVHLQGLINPIVSSYFPVNQSKLSFLFNLKYFFKNCIGTSPFFVVEMYKKLAARELKYFSEVKYVMGRTAWDKMVTKLYNPSVTYYHVDEALRQVFYQHKNNNLSKNENSFKIVSTLSPTIYKGIDSVLKAAKLFNESSNINFEWQIIGLEENDILLKHFEKTEKINHHKVNIKCLGSKNPDEIKKILDCSDVYVHPSYIDNSPNSVCEAQISGLPVIACNVGGVSSLISHMVSGILVPSNGIYEIVHHLIMLHDNNNLRNKLCKSGKEIAIERHDPAKIVQELLTVYTDIKNRHLKLIDI